MEYGKACTRKWYQKDMCHNELGIWVHVINKARKTYVTFWREKKFFILISYNICIWVLKLKRDLQSQPRWGNFRYDALARVVCKVGSVHNRATYLNITSPFEVSSSHLTSLATSLVEIGSISMPQQLSHMIQPTTTLIMVWVSHAQYCCLPYIEVYDRLH